MLTAVVADVLEEVAIGAGLTVTEVDLDGVRIDGVELHHGAMRAGRCGDLDLVANIEVVVVGAVVT